MRLLTCGSVDDGKSTLIGRLLWDASGVTDDQRAAIRTASVNRAVNGEKIDFSLLLDGLQAEREQGITIDIAWRYFETPTAASSSSIPPATSSIPATWRPARATPISPSSSSTPATA